MLVVSVVVMVVRREQAVRHGLDTADNHAHGQGLAKGAGHAQDDGGHERGQRASKDHVPDGLPAGIAQCKRTLAIAVGHGAQGIDRKRGDGRQD